MKPCYTIMTGFFINRQMSFKKLKSKYVHLKIEHYAGI